jgi:hypothetical protein
MKKECEFFSDKLLEYAFNELDGEPELKKKIEEHTAICTDCWNKVDGYRKTSAAAAAAMKPEFSEDVWEMQRRQIIKRVTHKVDVIAEARKFLKNVLTTRKLAAGFALFVALAAGAGAGFTYYSHEEKLREERVITAKIDMFENMGVIERLDFYKKMQEKGIEL